MKITLAETAGFCFGVNRALKMALEYAGTGSRSVTLGPLIHNKSAVNELRNKGVGQIDSVDEAEDGVTVIIRSHGVGKSVYEALENKGINYIDATCPFVLKIHEIVRQEHDQGRTIIIVGAPDHPEVMGIADGYERVVIFERPEELQEWIDSSPEKADLPISLVFQTTQTQKIKALFQNKVKNICTNARIFDTICKSTEKRQEEAAAIAKTNQAVIVLGDRSSSNSRKLADTCREFCSHVFFAETANEIVPDSIASFTTVGVTAGASTPPWIIKEVFDKMNEKQIADATVEAAVTDTAVQASPEVQEVQTAPVAEEAASVAAETTQEVAGEADAAVAEETPAEAALVEENVPCEAQSEEEESFESMLEKSFKTLHNGEKVTGTVTAITPTEVYVDLGTKHAGYIPMSEISDDPSVKAEDIFKIGDIVEAYTVRVNDVEGTAMLSKKRLDTVKNWSTVEDAYENKGTVEGTVTEENKGGVVVSVKGIRVFVPASQTGLPKDVPMSTLVKTKARIKITEVNRARRRVIGSIRAVKLEERRLAAEAIWNEIEEGKTYHGVVKSLTSYGAFVDIGGVDGMVHVTELSWDRIKNPAAVVSVGDEIDVYVISFDKEKKKISLGHKRPEDNPWLKFIGSYAVGDVATVKVVKFMTFGAFAQIIPGVDGLIHISQIADRRIAKPQDVLEEGQEVEAQITEIDEEKHRVSLSIRALLHKQQEAEAQENVPQEAGDEPQAEEEEKIIEVF